MFKFVMKTQSDESHYILMIATQLDMEVIRSSLSDLDWYLIRLNEIGNR